MGKKIRFSSVNKLETDELLHEIEARTLENIDEEIVGVLQSINNMDLNVQMTTVFSDSNIYKIIVMKQWKAFPGISSNNEEIYFMFVEYTNHSREYIIYYDGDIVPVTGMSDFDIELDDIVEVDINMGPEEIQVCDGINRPYVFYIENDIFSVRVMGIEPSIVKIGVGDKVSKAKTIEEGELSISATGIEKGAILRYCITQVDKRGLESNGSPITIDTDEIRISRIDETSEVYFEISNIELTNIIKQRDDIESVRLYRSSCFGVESAAGFEDFKYIDEYLIAAKDTNISINDTKVATAISINNKHNQPPIAELVTENNEVIYLGNTSAGNEYLFPIEDDKEFEIVINNRENKSFINRLFHIMIKSSDDIIDIALFNFNTDGKYRMYDSDKKTPCNVGWIKKGDNSKMSLYIKIPYIAPNSMHSLYLVKHVEDLPTAPINWRTFEYGEFSYYELPGVGGYISTDNLLERHKPRDKDHTVCVGAYENANGEIRGDNLGRRASSLFSNTELSGNIFGHIHDYDGDLIRIAQDNEQYFYDNDNEVILYTPNIVDENPRIFSFKFICMKPSSIPIGESVKLVSFTNNIEEAFFYITAINNGNNTIKLSVGGDVGDIYSDSVTVSYEQFMYLTFAMGFYKEERYNHLHLYDINGNFLGKINCVFNQSGENVVTEYIHFYCNPETSGGTSCDILAKYGSFSWINKDIDYLTTSEELLAFSSNLPIYNTYSHFIGSKDGLTNENIIIKKINNSKDLLPRICYSDIFQEYFPIGNEKIMHEKPNKLLNLPSMLSNKTNYSSMIGIFSENSKSIMTVIADGERTNLKAIVPEEQSGCIDKNSIQVTPYGTVYQSENGIMLWNSGGNRKLTDNKINVGTLKYSGYIRSKNQYYFSNTDNIATIIDLRNGNIRTKKETGVMQICNCSGVSDSENGIIIYDEHLIYNYPGAEISTKIDSKIESKKYVLGNHRLRWVKVHGDNSIDSLVVTVFSTRYTNGNRVFTYENVVPENKLRLGMGLKGESFSIKIESKNLHLKSIELGVK